MDIQALIGNVGGYIGLVLGCSILQVPELLEYSFKRMKLFYNKRCSTEEQ